jgi:hypothetical protein
VNVALAIGTLLAVAALAFVLYPVFYPPDHPVKHAAVVPRESQREAAVLALREIEFDRATGKLSDTDYADLKARYTGEAVLAMRREDAESEPSAGSIDGAIDGPIDEIETAVRAYRQLLRVCPTCGPRPEPDAEYCSACGRYLRDRCADCGAPVEALDARYCVSCGNRFAA